MNENLRKLFPVAGGVIGTVGTISGVITGLVKPGLEALLITFAVSLAIVLMIVAAAVIYSYRKRLASGRTPVVAGAGVLALAAGAGIGYVVSSAPPPSVMQEAAISAAPYRTFQATSDVTAVALSPDGKSLAASDTNGDAVIWNIATGRPIASLHGPNKHPVWDVAFNPDDMTLVDCATTNYSSSPSKSYVNGSVYLWNVASPAKPVAAFRDPQGAGIGTIAVSPDGKLLAAADGDGTVYLLDAANLKRIGMLQSTAPGSGYSIRGLAFSRDGSELAGANSNGSLYVWNVTAGTLVTDPLYDPGNQNPQYARGVAFSPDSTMVAVTDTDGNAYLWNMTQRTVVRTFRDPAGLEVVGVAFTPDGRYLITTSESGKDNHASAIRVWNAATGRLIHSFHDQGSYGSTRLALSNDGNILAVADDDARAYLWNLAWLHK